MTPGLLILELMVRAGSLPTSSPECHLKFLCSQVGVGLCCLFVIYLNRQQSTLLVVGIWGVVERDSQDQRWLVLPQVPAAGKHFLLSLLHLFEDDVLETWEVAIRVAAFSCKGRWESKKQDGVKQGLRKVHLTYVLKVPTAARATSFVCLF